MIEGFIVVVISLLFWGKVSKDTLENNPKMDIVKTIVYLTLSIILAIVYYKSSQVEISENRIGISKWVGSTNEKGESSDSVEVVVNYRMTLDNEKYSALYKHFNPLGGIDLYIKANNSYNIHSINPSNFKEISSFLNYCSEHPDFSKEIPENSYLGEIVKRYRKEIYQFNPGLFKIEKKLGKPEFTLSREDSIKLMDAYEYICRDMISLYFITHIPSKRKTFLPIDLYTDGKVFYKSGEYEDHAFCVKERFFVKEYAEPRYHIKGIEESKRLDKYAHNIFAFASYIGFSDHAPQSQDSISLWNVMNSDSLFNYIDYFTASDMSQRIFKVSFNSDIPLSGLSVVFDEPINISGIYPSPDLVGMNQIAYTDREKLEFFKNKPLLFHAKMPAYENKQLLRSLILTTILTAVFSLFCTNLYLCGRGLVRKFYTNSVVISEEDKKKYKKRINIYHYSIIAIVAIIAIIPIWLFIKDLRNDSLLIRVDMFIPLIGGIAIVLITILFAFDLWKDKLIPKGKDKEKGTNKANNEENLHS